MYILKTVYLQAVNIKAVQMNAVVKSKGGLEGKKKYVEKFKGSKCKNSDEGK